MLWELQDSFNASSVQRCWCFISLILPGTVYFSAQVPMKGGILRSHPSICRIFPGLSFPYEQMVLFRSCEGCKFLKLVAAGAMKSQEAGCRQSPACSSWTAPVCALACPSFPKSWVLTTLTHCSDTSSVILLVLANLKVLEAQLRSFRQFIAPWPPGACAFTKGY